MSPITDTMHLSWSGGVVKTNLSCFSGPSTPKSGTGKRRPHSYMILKKGTVSTSIFRRAKSYSFLPAVCFEAVREQHELLSEEAIQIRLAKNKID